MYQNRGLKANITQEKGYLAISVLMVALICIAGDRANALLSASIFALCLFFINRPEYLLPAVLVSSLLGDYFVAFSGIGMSRLTVMAYIIICLLHTLINRKAVNKTAFVSMVIASVFCFISAMVSEIGDVKPAITMILNLLMAFFMSSNMVRDRKRFMRAMQYSIWVFTAFLLITALRGDANYYESDRLMIGDVGPNNLGMCAAQVLVYLAVSAYLETDKRHMVMDLLFALACFYIIGLTGSRGALIAAIVAVAVLVFPKIGRRVQKKHLWIFAAVVVGAWIGWKLLEAYAPDMLQRFTVEDLAEDGGTGRLEIWKAMIIHVIPDNLLLGVGYGGWNTQLAMAPYVPKALGVHNMYLTVLAQVGIVGSAMFYAFWWNCLKKGWKVRKQDVYMMIPLFMLLAAFVNGISEEVISERFLWFNAGLVFLIAYNVENENWGVEHENSIRS